MINKHSLSLKQISLMISGYAKEKTLAQLKAVFFVVSYLFLFQLLVLQVPVKDSLIISAGIGMVIIGLALFLEGLLLGIMPLGELCGLKLPRKTGLFFLLFFAFFLGIVATLAEPAIAILQGSGKLINAWEAPLLYSMLNRYSMVLVLSIASGVGIAVLLGVLRFLKNWSLKPLITIIIPLILGLSIFAFFDDNMRHITALSWDCGGITTGPVTVPLIISLGIGITRATGNSEKGISGLGVVTLASAVPVGAVLLAGIIIGTTVPNPMSKSDFFHFSNRDKVSAVFESTDKYIEYSLGNQELQQVIINQFEGDEEKYNLFTSQKSDYYKQDSSLLSGFLSALRAVLPLSILLMLLVLVMKERVPFFDEKILGIIFAVAGFFLFSAGMDNGLEKLGLQSGRNLPVTFTSIAFPEEEVIIQNFDLTDLKSAYNEDGKVFQYFVMKKNNVYTEIVFNNNLYDAETQSYRYIPEKGPILGSRSKTAGIALFLLFAFFLGLGATIAEPALNALGITLEEISIGTFHKSFLVQTVAAGVGAGLIFGMLRILWDIPLIYILLPAYAVSIMLSWFSSEEFVNIAWDCGGVTTGPVTVPLVIALGIGTGGQAGKGVESFGILALASVFPIMAVLAAGIIINRKQKRVMETDNE